MKVRGVRIELGDVESALVSHPLVDRAVVAGRRTTTGTELVGYVTIDGAAAVNEADVIAHVRTLLPDVMVPGRAVVLDDFPLLPNGKVNRSALPEPGHDEARPSHDAEVLLSSDHQAMLDVWRDVMARPALGADDDFFAAGGHSLLAMRLVSRIKRDLGIRIGLAQFLRTTTARSLADSVAAPVPDADEPLRYVVPIADVDPALRNLFLVHGAGGDILSFRSLGRSLAGRLNVFGVQAAGVDGDSPLHSSADEMAASYLREIRRVQPAGPYLLGGFSTGGIIAVELTERLTSEGEDVEWLVLLDVFHPSTRPRNIPLTEHLGKLLFTVGPRYGIQKLAERIERRRRDRTMRRYRDEPTGGPVPFEVRKWQITMNNIQLWADYDTGTIDVPVLLTAAEEVFDIWEGMIDERRGWADVAPDLTVISVPGDHLSLVDDPHVEVLAERLAAALDA